ncbi:MAG: hypothetical protein ACUVWQ_07725 [Candidatus Aminicenantales bacterium]
MRKEKLKLAEILRVRVSPRSADYVKNKTQFQLHSLLTEQRHPITWNLSQVIKKDVAEGLKLLFQVDQDISRRLENMAAEEAEVALLEQAARSVVNAILRGNKLFFYGCGSTGRLAKFMESTLWRPFWKKIKKHRLKKKIFSFLPADIEERLIGEMTGGDRALISALEGLEDLELIGRLQVRERQVTRGDVIFAVTEGGETSSVIGAILEAAEMWSEKRREKVTGIKERKKSGPLNEFGTNGEKNWATIKSEDCRRGQESLPDIPEEIKDEARRHLYFVFNNPEELLWPFERSRRVLRHPLITKINLTTGPQAITGSTRLQATTIETYVLGLILEKAIFLLLANGLEPKELIELGFKEEPQTKKSLRNFAVLPETLLSHADQLASFTSLEAATYLRKRRTTYLANGALLTVFIDGAERSPTFHVSPLDPVNLKRRRCWFQVWTEAANRQQAWQKLLGRKFRGLDPAFYYPHLQEKVDDPYLKEAALKSILLAGNDEQNRYDFSFSPPNLQNRSPRRGDLGVIVGVEPDLKKINSRSARFVQFVDLCRKKESGLVLTFLGSLPPDKFWGKIKNLRRCLPRRHHLIYLRCPAQNDPLLLRQQLLLKMFLNAHSTGVMALLGRVVGNTMTAVSPSNLKLIGRATYLIMSHINDTVTSWEWKRRFGQTKPISYGEANALLFEAMKKLTGRQDERSEVELCIIRALEASRLGRFVSWEAAARVATSLGLENYLCRFNPRLRYPI